MRIALILVISLFTAISAHSQDFTFGVKGGLSTSYLNVKDISQNGYSLKNDKGELGFHAGIFSRVSMFGFHLQPEFYYSESGGSIKLTDTNNQSHSAELKIRRLDMPVLVGMKILFVRISAGPVFSLTLDQDIKNLKGALKDLAQNYDDATIGIQAGLGVDFLKYFTLDARFEHSLSKSVNKFQFPGGATAYSNLRNGQVIFSLGYKIIR